MTCDLCRQPITPGDPYSLSEHGRLHSACLRTVQDRHHVVFGPQVRHAPRVEFTDPIFGVRYPDLTFPARRVF